MARSELKISCSDSSKDTVLKTEVTRQNAVIMQGHVHKMEKCKEDFCTMKIP